MALAPPIAAAPGFGGGKNRDNPTFDHAPPVWRRFLRSIGFRPGSGTWTQTLEGSEAGAVTSVPLSAGATLALEIGAVGIPVASRCRIASVAVSWMAGTPPSGDWTLTLYRRRGSGDLSAAATFAVTTA